MIQDSRARDRTGQAEVFPVGGVADSLDLVVNTLAEKVKA